MNFEGFTTDSFEQLIRTLSLKIFGPGVRVFGNGPDAGREATFEGKVPYPFPPAQSWDGYGVIQAKYKEKRETTQKDQDWAIKELDEELAVWRISDNRQPKPDYFVFCTNVELSSAANGGKDRAENVLKTYSEECGLKGYAIWDANQLKSLIDGQSEIRTRFNAFFTTGDLLAVLAARLSQLPNPDAVLTAYLTGEIVSEEDARLSQAGDRSEDRIRLADVFTDLPVDLAEQVEPADEPGFSQDALRGLLLTSFRKLDPQALSDSFSGEDAFGISECFSQRFARYLFIGGPGSGKSTLGQFLAQIHRAALLQRRQVHKVEYNVRTIIAGLENHCKAEQLPWPATPRYPLRIELNAFAKALFAGSTDRITTLSEYLRKQISKDVPLTHHTLLEWLALYPSILILDGLDEVPSSSNRDDVIRAIRAFLAECRNANADMMIVSTTRPEGYGGEFDDADIQHLFLQPLPKSKALQCAKRYATAKGLAKGNRRVEEVISIIDASIESPLIARLMRSPLQITFMVTVVFVNGKPSDTRWQLFNDYYRIIYDRELHKAIPPFSDVLSSRRQDIDTLHHRIGFILQCRAEKSGGTQSDLPITEFDELVRECLDENGLSPAELAENTARIVGAAKLRLVFLTSRNPGRLSFDVRSLQEYMAAAAITTGDSELIISRLATIAHAGFWRNTFLFVVGRFFADAQMRHARDKIRVFCEDLNNGSDNAAIVKLGSRLALEILESGAASNVPLATRGFVNLALKLLSDPQHNSTASCCGRLAALYSKDVEQIYENTIRTLTNHKELFHAMPAWIVAIHLTQRGVEWAKALVADNWPDGDDQSLVVLREWISQTRSFRYINALDKLSAKRLQTCLLREPPVSSIRRLSLANQPPLTIDGLDQLHALSQLADREDGLGVSVLYNGKRTGLSLKAQSSADGAGRVVSLMRRINASVDVHPHWKQLMTLAEIVDTPSNERIVEYLEAISAGAFNAQLVDETYITPWVFMAASRMSDDAADISDSLRRVSQGGFGGPNDWAINELRWKTHGIELAELVEMSDRNPLPLILGVQSASASESEDETEQDGEFTRSLWDAFEAATVRSIRKTLAWLIPFYTGSVKTTHLLDPAQIAAELLPARTHASSSDWTLNADAVEHKAAWVEFYDHFGSLAHLRFSPSWRHDKVPAKMLENALSIQLHRPGLIRLLACWNSSGSSNALDVDALLQFAGSAGSTCSVHSLALALASTHLGQGHTQAIVGLLDHLPSVGNAEQAQILSTTLERHGGSIDNLEVIATKMLSRMDHRMYESRARLNELRYQKLLSRPSGLTSVHLEELGLPSRHVFSQHLADSSTSA